MRCLCLSDMIGMQRGHGGESRALPELTGDRQAPAMAREDVLDDRQAESGAPFGAALAGVDAIEPLGEPGQMLGLYAAPEIAHAEPALARRPRHHDLDAIAIG